MGFEWGYDKDSDDVPLDPHDPHDLAQLQWQDRQEAQRREDAWRAHMSTEDARRSTRLFDAPVMRHRSQRRPRSPRACSSSSLRVPLRPGRRMGH
eukprot:4590961-Prymnesium_polylepis.1